MKNKNTEKIILAMSPELKSFLQKRATDDDRPLVNFIRHILTQYMKSEIEKEKDMDF